MISQLTDLQKGYLAGFIDGEGYIGLTRTSTNITSKQTRRGFSYRIMLSIRNTDVRALLFLKEITGMGKVIKNKEPKADQNYKQSYTWNTWSIEAMLLLMEIVDYLIIKREVAELVIKFQMQNRRPGRAGLTNDEWEYREEIFEQCKNLNRVGKN